MYVILVSDVLISWSSIYILAHPFQICMQHIINPIRPQRFQWWVHMCSVLAQKENSSSNRFCKYHSALDCCVLILHCYKFKNSQQLVIKSCLQRTVPSKSHSTAGSVSARPLFIIISFPLQVWCAFLFIPNHSDCKVYIKLWYGHGMICT